MKSFLSSRYMMIAVFAFFLYFFTIAHPVYPFDIDDWGYMTSTRWAHPILFDWNPTRVLPELLIPICSEISFILTRITGISIVDTMTAVTAILLSSVIMFYYESVENFLIKRCGAEICDARFISVFFLAMHFIAFSLRYEQNPHFFYSHDLCCYYYYTIPNLLCAIFVLHYLTGRITFIGKSYKTAVYVLILYLLLLSNLYSSIIIASFFGVLLLHNLISCLLNKEFGIVQFFLQNKFFILIISAWLIVHLIELTGGRAASLPYSSFLGVEQSLKSLNWELHTLTTKFVGIILLVSVVYLFLKKKKILRDKMLLMLCSMSFFALVYSFLLSARVDARYMMRSDVLFSWFFFLLLAFVYASASIFKRFKFMRIISFVLLIIYMTHCNKPSRTFMDVNNVNPKWGMELSRRNIDYIKNLEHEENKKMILPKFPIEGNFPLSPSFYGDNIVKLLYKQGEIKYIYHVEDIVDTVYAPCYMSTEYQMVYY